MANKPYYELQYLVKLDTDRTMWVTQHLYGTKKECEQHKKDKIAAGVPGGRLRIERLQ